MTRVFISIIWFLVFLKLFVFWVWLWQIKEYHWGRFKAHFETRKIRKLLFSFHGLRYPKLTPKVIVILISGIVFEFLVLWFNARGCLGLTSGVEPILLLILIILAPIISSLLVLLFQIPRKFLMKRILEKARRKREQFKNLIVIGITGSYGKSSTKEFLATILSEKFRVLKTPQNINAEIGIAKTILNELSSSHQVFVAEIGAYERGKIKEVCQMLQPQIGILTGINEQHLSTFGSLENIRKAKYELIESLPRTIIVRGLPPDGTAILKDKLDLRAESVKVFKESVFFKVFARDGSFANFGVDVLGKQNIENILLAIFCARKLGMSLEEISRACLKIKPEQGGMKFLRKDGPTIIDSSYSANPDGVIADLEYLKLYSGKKIIVMPCLIELGSVGSGIHQRIGRKIAEACDLAIITTKDYFKEIKKGAETGSLSLLFIEKPEKIAAKIKEFNNPEDVVLLEGRVPKELCHLLSQSQYL